MWYLNSKQADAFADFLFDLAKGFVLGAAGFSTGMANLSPTLRMIYLVGGLFLAYNCIKTALSVLEK